FDLSMVRRAGHHKEFLRVVHEELQKTVLDTRATVGMFDSQREYMNFERKLGPLVDTYLARSVKDLKSEYDGPRKDKKIIIAPEEASVVPSTSLAPPAQKKRGRPKLKDKGDSVVAQSADSVVAIVTGSPPPRKKSRVANPTEEDM
ncbi:unnamed protein product, partial [Symbiodinium microadriaticum]